MNVWDRLGEWLATLIVASLTWVTGALSPAASTPANLAVPGEAPPGFMLGWAQDVDQPPIEQVGEGTGDDVETLDEGAPPADDAQAADQETLDAGAPPAAAEEDIELLDQGAPPVADTAVQPVAVDTVSVAPVADATTTAVAPEPAAATGPVLPAGFGTGRVQAAAGRSGVPIGLEDCHVGAVTGRAYVGVDCGEEGKASFVGHAPSFEDFPFVLEAEFPFEGDEAFFTEPNFPFGDDAELVAAARDDGEDTETDVFVSAGRGRRSPPEDDSSAPVVEAPATTTVEFAQRAREREPRVRVDERGSKGSKDKDGSGKRGNTNSGVNAESNDDERRNGGSKSKKKSKRNDDTNQARNERVGAEGKEDQAKDDKDKNDKKQRRDRKQKRDRS